MELFQRAKTVRLRTVRDKYLVADDDKETVCQDRDGSLAKAQWVVELVPGKEALRFRSCYGKYLTASNIPFLPGAPGKKVIQALPPDMGPSVEWEPLRDGFQVRLRTQAGHFLRPNGGLPPWRNSVTHDIPHRSKTQEKVLWNIEVVETLPPPRQNQSDNVLGKSRSTSAAVTTPTMPQKFKATMTLQDLMYV